MVNRTKKEPQRPLVHKVLIAESCPLFRSAIKQVLEKTVHRAQITETGTAQEAVRVVRRQSFDLAILDISLPDRNGTDLVKELKLANADLRILVLTMLPEAEYAVRVFQSGANGYLSKNAPPQEVADAVKIILDGKEYVSNAAAQHLAREVKSTFVKFPHETLSSRESQVFRGLVAGNGLTEIAETLNLNVTTVSTYRARVLGKIHAKTNADLVRYAVHHNLVP